MHHYTWYPLKIFKAAFEFVYLYFLCIWSYYEFMKLILNMDLACVRGTSQLSEGESHAAGWSALLVALFFKPCVVLCRHSFIAPGGKDFPTLSYLIHHFALWVAHVITSCSSDLQSLSFLLCDQNRLLVLVPFFSLFGDLSLGEPASFTSPAHDVPSPAASHGCSTRLYPLRPAGRVASMQSDARADFR